MYKLIIKGRYQSLMEWCCKLTNLLIFKEYDNCHRFIISEGEIYFDSFGFLVLTFVLITCLPICFSLRLCVPWFPTFLYFLFFYQCFTPETYPLLLSPGSTHSTISLSRLSWKFKVVLKWGGGEPNDCLVWDVWHFNGFPSTWIFFWFWRKIGFNI